MLGTFLKPCLKFGMTTPRPQKVFQKGKQIVEKGTLFRGPLVVQGLYGMMKNPAKSGDEMINHDRGIPMKNNQYHRLIFLDTNTWSWFRQEKTTHADTNIWVSIKILIPKLGFVGDFARILRFYTIKQPFDGNICHFYPTTELENLSLYHQIKHIQSNLTSRNQVLFRWSIFFGRILSHMS